MRMARGSVHGEAIEVAKRRRYLTDAEAASVRRRWMARLKAEGVPVKEIAGLWRCSWQHVYREIAIVEAESHDQRRAG